MLGAYAEVRFDLHTIVNVLILFLSFKTKFELVRKFSGSCFQVRTNRLKHKKFKDKFSNEFFGCRSANVSATSSEIREEAELLLRGDLDPSESMCAFLDGEVVLKKELVYLDFQVKPYLHWQCRAHSQV